MEGSREHDKCIPRPVNYFIPAELLCNQMWNSSILMYYPGMSGGGSKTGRGEDVFLVCAQDKRQRETQI